jgi:type I restriction enzyme S subunit
LPFFTPDIVEQKKITDFLITIDKKIDLLKEKYTLLDQYKTGVMQKLFSQKIHFKDENDNDFPDWTKGTLADLSDKISNKNKDESVTNVLTNSAKFGIVNQTDYFKKDIANQSNLGGYSIVEKDDFVYNPRISELAPVGPIKRNHIGQGVMSPLYTVFRFKNDDVLDYLELYFGTTQWHRYMNSIANIGARHDRMNITMGDFFNLPIPIPSYDEMAKIVGFVQSLNKKVDLVAQQLKQTQIFRKGLLQQMFV